MIMTDDQQEVYDGIFNVKDPNIRWNLVTGGPGSGKSLMIKLIHNTLIENRIPHYILATTNLVARSIDGQTFHNAIGGGQNLIKTIRKIDEDNELEHLWRSRDPMKAISMPEYVDIIRSHFKKSFKFLNSKNATYCSSKETKKLVIIIDEIGMVEVSLFYILLYHVECKDTSFILFGDENQLEPIHQKSVGLFEIFEWMKERGYLQSFHLRGNVRHKDSAFFMKFVSDFWNENRDRRELKHLKFGGNEKEFDKLLHPKIVLCGKHKTVNHYQNKLLAEFPGEEITIAPILKKRLISEVPRGAIFESFADTEKLLAGIKVKKHVPIIITANIGILVHGNRCKYVDFENDFVKATMDEDEFTISRVNFFVISKGSIFEIRQFPFNLNFAMTVHLSQGMTLNMPGLVLFNDMWTEKQKYTALTRLTRSYFIFYDVDPFLVPSTLCNPLPIANNETSIVENKCSQCKVAATKLHLVAAQTKRRVTDESLSLNYLCDQCINTKYS